MYVLWVLSSVWVFHTSTWAVQNANYIGIRDLAPSHREQIKLLTCQMCMVALDVGLMGTIVKNINFRVVNGWVRRLVNSFSPQRTEFNPCWFCCGWNCTGAGFLRVHLPSDTSATAMQRRRMCQKGGVPPGPGTVGRSTKGSASPHPSNKIHDISGTPVFLFSRSWYSLTFRQLV